jgi:hypothetical protein
MPVLVLLCAVLAAGQQPATGTAATGGTSPASPAPATSTAASPVQDAAQLPVSLDRIQRALAGPAPLELKEQHPIFRLEVFGRKPTLEDLLGEKFWLGPAPYGGMTHKEFLDMVTPKEAQPFGGFSGKYLVAETALTLIEQWALKSAIHKFQTAHDDHEREAARKEVLDALAALEKARRDAGLPPSGTPPK